MKNDKIKIVVACGVAFTVWAGLATYRTLEKNKDWFESKPVSAEAVLEREDIKTTDKKEFTYALAWSKCGENWVLTNIDGHADFTLDKQYTKVTDFCNSAYAILQDANGMKSVIDRSGKLRLAEYCYKCDKIISDNFQANMIIATKETEKDGKTIVEYGIIGDSLDWVKAPSVDNEYLKEFTQGIDGGVFSNDAGDKLYFYTLDVVVENVDEFMFYDDQLCMFRRGNEVYLIDKSGEHERVSMQNIASVGEWTEGVIYCELTDGRKVFNDINGTILLDVTNLNVINKPRFIEGHAGILMNTEEGLKYTVIDLEGNMLFEPKFGVACDTLTHDVFRVVVHNEEESKDEMSVINEKGEILFNVNSSITYFTNGYAIKDNDIYVRTDGTELNLYRDKEI